MAEQNNQQMQEMVAQALKQAMSQVNGLMGQPNAAAVTPAAPMAQPVAQANFMPAQQAPMMGGMPNLTGWSVPVEWDLNGMVVTLYLNFPANTFSQAQQIIMTLVNSGMQVRAFQKNGGSGFGGNNNGGWYNRGGGYGGGYRRGWGGR